MILKIVVLNGLLIILLMSSAFFRCREEIQIIVTFCRALSGCGALGAGDGSSFNTLCGAQKSFSVLAAAPFTDNRQSLSGRNALGAGDGKLSTPLCGAHPTLSVLTALPFTAHLDGKNALGAGDGDTRGALSPSQKNSVIIAILSTSQHGTRTIDNAPCYTSRED